MTTEQFTTIMGNFGVAVFLYWVIRGLKAQIGSLNKTVEVQQKTLEAMETRVSETEKIGNIYRQLFDELPNEVDKWKVAILKLKNEQIDELEKANQDKDERLKKTVTIELEKLELQQQALEDIPGLRQELIEVVSTLQQRLAVVEQLSLFPSPGEIRLANKYRKVPDFLADMFYLHHSPSVKHSKNTETDEEQRNKEQDNKASAPNQ